MSSSALLIRLCTFFTLTIVWYFGFFWVAVPLSIWYCYSFRAYELVLLGFLIDAYFITTLTIPLYTTSFLALFLAIEFLKPRLRKNDIV